MVHQRRAQIMLFEDHWVCPIPPLMKLYSRINNLTTMGEVFHFPISLIIIFLSSNFSIRYHPQERSLWIHPVIICTNCTIIYVNLCSECFTPPPPPLIVYLPLHGIENIIDY